MHDKLKESLAITLIIVVMLPAYGAAETHYFPSKPGVTFDYTYGPVEIVGLSDGSFARLLCGSCIVGSSRSFIVTPDGDVFTTEYGSFAIAAPDPEIWHYDEPLLYLDLPLETGKTWTDTRVARGLWGEVDVVTLTGEVVGPATVTVPAGEFEVIVVTFRWEYAVDPGMNGTQELWLHRQLGPVNGLESWEGIVDESVTSWGEVKARYR